MRRTDPTEPVWETVDHDVSTGIYAERRSAGAVGSVGIGEVQGEVVGAVVVPAVDDVRPLGCAVVSLLDLGPNRLTPQRD